VIRLELEIPADIPHAMRGMLYIASTSQHRKPDMNGSVPTLELVGQGAARAADAHETAMNTDAMNLRENMVLLLVRTRSKPGDQRER
jgi:hypothetical protein